jgi:hypothetical protein
MGKRRCEDVVSRLLVARSAEPKQVWYFAEAMLYELEISSMIPRHPTINLRYLSLFNAPV